MSQLRFILCFIYIYIVYQILASVRFVICSVASFVSTTLAKRWTVKFLQGFAQFNNVDQEKTTSNNDIAILYIYIHRPSMTHMHMYICMCV